MKGMKLVLGLLAFLMVSGSLVDAQEVAYLGKAQGREVGFIRMVGQYYEVVEGTVIPNWGTVKMITDGHLILHRVLSEADKQELKRQGATVYDILEIHVPHEDLRVVPVW